VSLHEHHWLFKFVRKILSLFSAKEVKAPLSFFDRLKTTIVVLAGLGVYFVQPKERLDVLIGAGALLFLLTVIVAALTWSRPQNLVFKESSYRKLSDKQNISSAGVLNRGRSAA
jgi:hypothetical protein